MGGVVRPGQDIIEIVPLDDTLLIEAQIRPADIAFLRPGQESIIKVAAYDFSIYGGLKAKLEHISADTIKDEQGESFYRVYLRGSSTFQMESKRFPSRGGDQVDHGDVGGGVSVSACLCPSGWKRPLRPSMRALLWLDVQR